MYAVAKVTHEQGCSMLLGFKQCCNCGSLSLPRRLSIKSSLLQASKQLTR